MDTLTHTVLGATVGEAILGKKIGKAAMLWGALFSNLPDIDTVTHFYMDPVDGLLAHRGFTHSILFSWMLIPVLTLFFFKMYQKRETTHKDWLKFFFITSFSHLFLDCLTSYGTGLLEPFSHDRISINTIFVIDPFYTLPILISTLALLILKRDARARKAFVIGGLTISTMYLVFTFIIKKQVDKTMVNSMKAQHHNYTSMMTTPTPLNAILWNAIASNDSGYWVGNYSLLDSKKEIEFYFIPRNDSLIRDEIREERMQKLIRFSQGFYAITQEKDALFFHDLRFGQTMNWDSASAPFSFNYRINGEGDGAIFLQKGRLQGNFLETISHLIRRIKGN